MKRTKKRKIQYEESSDNIFTDLDVPNPEEALAKSQVAIEIRKVIKQKKLTQVKAAKVLKIDQPKASLLLRGYLTNFSLERLFRFLNDLGQDVYISISPSKSSRHGSTHIRDSSFKDHIAALEQDLLLYLCPALLNNYRALCKWEKPRPFTCRQRP